MAPGDIRDTFEKFRDELDEHNDRRERLIKASRDVTNISKKTIFLLHRIVQESQGDASSYHDSRIRAANQGRDKLRQVQEIYNGLKEELVGDQFWRYERQVSPGLQEYIEALSFAHYLEHGNLITHAQVQATLVDADGTQFFPLTTYDYLLGVSDLTGELMRYAISGFGRTGGRSRANEVCAFVRNCRADFERLTPYIRDLNKKQAVTSQSLAKIEDAAYAVAIRALEYELSPDELDRFVANFLSTYSENAGGHDQESL
ncbi:translin family protein [Moniliophthora roreri MCA 2997]|uniref:Translin family protein n=1 Tax=Moniliophthora roreri (strain MCA 2997) TaxID=1381753 RepID=V2Z3C6_MONRO|nr:translin family protein [Moniliophthora roreri MCA 2997]KAI3622727.1 translin family protein [Moniliophthora roreri]